MYRFIPLIIGALLLNAISGFAQVVIDYNDMPEPDDTLRVSLTNLVPEGYQRAAQDTVWDFSSLEALTQRVDTFMAATSTPATYQFVFVLLGGSNLAAPRNVSIIPGVPVTDGFTFFKNSTASFSDMGSAFTLQGIPFPAKYDSPDVRYQFPMSPGQEWSSESAFSLTVPGLGYISTHRTRSNLVDGWGIVTTPFGTFQSLRVKSDVTENDSVYIDSLGMGIPVSRLFTEYKWLAKNMGIPVLTITEEGPVVTAEYRDIPRQQTQSFSVSLGEDTAVAKGSTVTVTASVTGGTPPFRFLWSTLDTTASVTLTIQEPQSLTVFVMDALQNVTFGQKTIYILYPPGMSEKTNEPAHIWPNPATHQCFIETGTFSESVRITIVDPSGRTVLDTKEISSSAGIVTIETSPLDAGCYLLTVGTSNGNRRTKLVVE
jgi:hypothetical protein